MLVSMILPVHNDEKIVKCLNSLKNQDYKNTEIIVIDDASTDETLNVIKKEFPKIRIYEFKKNKGRSYARNYGFKKSKGDYVFFAESDAVYAKDFIINCLKLKPDACIGRMRILNKEKYLAYLRSLEVDARFSKDYRPFSAWFFKREVLENVGLFDESLEAGEDVDLGKRLKDKGYRILYAKNANWYHTEPSSLKAVIKKSLIQGIKSDSAFKKQKKIQKGRVLDVLILISIILPFLNLTALSLTPLIFLIYLLMKKELFIYAYGKDKKNLIPFFFFQLIKRYSVFIGVFLRYTRLSRVFFSNKNP